MIVSSELPNEARPGHPLIPVPWDQADALRERLKDRGLPVVVVYDPQDHTAALEVPPQLDIEMVRAALDGLEGVDTPVIRPSGGG